MKLFEVHGQYNTKKDEVLEIAKGDASWLVAADCIASVAAKYGGATTVKYIGEVEVIE